MKLLMENWRKFLDEQMTFGDQFEKWLHGEGKCEAQSLDSQCLKEHGFKIIDIGSFRRVYQLPDNPNFVMKAATGPHADNPALPSSAKEMNEAEANAIINTGYPDLLPKVYETAKDFSWIVMEKVEPYEEGDESWLDDYFPIFKDFMTKHQDNKEFRFRYDTTETLFKIVLDLKLGEMRVKRRLSNLSRSIGGEDMRQELEENLPPLFDRLLSLVNEAELATFDIRAGNVGTASDGRFVLLDLGWGLETNKRTGQTIKPAEREYNPETRNRE